MRSVAFEPARAAKGWAVAGRRQGGDGVEEGTAARKGGASFEIHEGSKPLPRDRLASALVVGRKTDDQARGLGGAGAQAPEQLGHLRLHGRGIGSTLGPLQVVAAHLEHQEIGVAMGDLLGEMRRVPTQQAAKDATANFEGVPYDPGFVTFENEAVQCRARRTHRAQLERVHARGIERDAGPAAARATLRLHAREPVSVVDAESDLGRLRRLGEPQLDRGPASPPTAPAGLLGTGGHEGRVVEFADRPRRCGETSGAETECAVVEAASQDSAALPVPPALGAIGDDARHVPTALGDGKDEARTPVAEAKPKARSNLVGKVVRPDRRVAPMDDTDVLAGFRLRLEATQPPEKTIEGLAAGVFDRRRHRVTRDGRRLLMERGLSDGWRRFGGRRGLDRGVLAFRRGDGRGDGRGVGRRLGGGIGFTAAGEREGQCPSGEGRGEARTSAVSAGVAAGPVSSSHSSSRWGRWGRHGSGSRAGWGVYRRRWGRRSRTSNSS